MKKLLIILMSISLSLGVSAQRIGHGFAGKGFYSPHYYSRPHVYIGGYAPFYGYGYPFYGFSTSYPFYGFGYPYYGYPYGYNHYRPTSKLAMQIEDIKSDYKDKIWSARQDKSLTRAERRKEIRNLKRERDQAVIDAQRNYYKSK